LQVLVPEIVASAVTGRTASLPWRQLLDDSSKVIGSIIFRRRSDEQEEPRHKKPSDLEAEENSAGEQGLEVKY
jgi:hypothetical protein